MLCLLIRQATFFIHIPPLSLLISFVWLHPLASMGKQDREMLVARVRLKHTDQGQKLDRKPGTRNGREYLAQM